MNTLGKAFGLFLSMTVGLGIGTMSLALIGLLGTWLHDNYPSWLIGIIFYCISMYGICYFIVKER